jgi:hypothetical protein
MYVIQYMMENLEELNNKIKNLQQEILNTKMSQSIAEMYISKFWDVPGTMKTLTNIELNRILISTIRFLEPKLDEIPQEYCDLANHIKAHLRCNIHKHKNMMSEEELKHFTSISL